MVVYPGLLELELGAVLTLCALAGGDGAAHTVARSRASIVTAGGLVMTPELMFAALEPPRAVFVPGGVGAARAARDPLVRNLVRAQRERGAVIGAAGSALRILGEAGLLEGRVVSTDPDLAATLAEFHPSEVRGGELSDDDGLVTARGLLGALDVGLRLVRFGWGEDREAEVRGRLGV